MIDFLIAISVLPLATFTSISVLGGSNGVPDWMLEPEDRLENLQMDSLEAPKSEEGDAIIPSQIDEEIFSTPDNGHDDSEGIAQGGMIDLPFELFGSDRED